MFAVGNVLSREAGILPPSLSTGRPLRPAPWVPGVSHCWTAAPALSRGREGQCPSLSLSNASCPHPALKGAEAPDPTRREWVNFAVLITGLPESLSSMSWTSLWVPIRSAGTDTPSGYQYSLRRDTDLCSAVPIHSAGANTLSGYQYAQRVPICSEGTNMLSGEALICAQQVPIHSAGISKFSGYQYAIRRDTDLCSAGSWPQSRV